MIDYTFKTHTKYKFSCLSFVLFCVPSFGAAIESSNVGAFSKNIGLARSADSYGGQIVSRIQF